MPTSFRPILSAQQLEAVLSDYDTHAAKTGFLGRVDFIEMITDKLSHYKVKQLVVDPVIVNNRNITMFGPEVIAAYRQKLIPIAQIITPNIEEARVLLGYEPLDDTLSAAQLATQLHEDLRRTPCHHYRHPKRG